ncbi:MAG: hypothetical protein ACFFB3_07145 [Candidatus Hodarchaeota archaeon]
MTRVYLEHFCLLVFAQDRWKEKNQAEVMQLIREAYIRGNPHADCDLCMNCPVCRGLWDLFEPNNLGEYVSICTVCNLLNETFLGRLGSNDGVVLFAHTKLSAPHLREFAKSLLDSSRIKKIFVLQVDSFKVGSKTLETLQQLKQEKMKLFAFQDLLKEEKNEFNVIYEVSRGQYY